MAGACPGRIPEYIALVTRMRSVIKQQSRRWDMGRPATRDRLYRLLYGGRAAVEEAMLQARPARCPPSSAARTSLVHTLRRDPGCAVHSGDILVSRGGAPTSALIARGNDYPGNFSHVALVHVDGRSRAASVVESHIERGVAVATLPEYVRDVKLRVMVLRLRADLPQIAADPHSHTRRPRRRCTRRGAPHPVRLRNGLLRPPQALLLGGGLRRVRAVRHHALDGPLAHLLARARLLARGVRRDPLRDAGAVRPRVRPAALCGGRVARPQDAVRGSRRQRRRGCHAGGCRAGDTLDDPWYLLAPARLAKLYSSALNAFGLVGPVPEGLSAAGALRTRRFIQTHALIRDRVLRLAKEFQRAHGYVPPYWELVKLARRAASEIGSGA